MQIQAIIGRAGIEIVYALNIYDNDSLVVLITYGKTRFLFTGDIEDNAQKKVIEKYTNTNDNEFKINVMKLPHHGAWLNQWFLRTFMPDYAVISVGKNNPHHPTQDTLDKLRDEKRGGNSALTVYRTDINGNITVISNGKQILVNTDH